MTVPPGSLPQRDRDEASSGLDARHRWRRVVVGGLLGAALVAAGLFVFTDRGPVSEDGEIPDDDAAAPDGASGPGGDEPGSDDGLSGDGPAPEGAAPPNVRYGDEPRAIWDVTGVGADDVLNIRAGPGTDFSITGTLAPDTVELESTGRVAWVGDARWREIVVPGATTGWVHARYLTGHEPIPVPPLPAPSPAPSPDPLPDQLPASLRGAEWDRIPTTQKVVALTFDAGANADGVRSILGTLEATNTPATFFLTGRWTESEPELARRIAADYPVGNHSVTHPYFTKLTDAQLRDEVLGAEAIIEKVTGRSTRPFFRFPYGDRDARTIGLVNDAGYGSFRWTVDTLGWKGTSGGVTTATVIERVMDTASPGQIILLHVGSHPTDKSTLDADALPEIIERLRAQGYRFITLTEALSIARD